MLYNRVLITGANGLLGRELVTLMSGSPEYDVLATGLDPNPRFADASCGYAPLDITSVADVRNIFQDFTPDVVINCAAMTNVDACEDAREDCWKINVDAVQCLARQCKASGARLVHVSTDFVFDGQNGPYNETARPNPLSFYGRSKLASENAVRDAALDKWAIARTVLVYGTPTEDGRSNIVLWVIRELSAGRPINVVTDQWRTPTYAPDLAAGIERIVRFNKNGIYNISGSELVSIYDFARLVAEVFDLDASLVRATDSTQFRQPAARPPRTGFIILKAETELGFRPRSLREALRNLGVRLGLPVVAS